MADMETRDSRTLSLSPDRCLDRPTDTGRGRSVSAAPSSRSTRSHITTVEEKEGLPGFNKAELEQKKKQLNRQQTYKFGRSLSLMERLRGVFSPQWLMAKMEESIEVVPTEVTADELFQPWIVDVYVSPKYGSANYHKIRCLLDTGCSHGNIVSREFVEQLGYTEEDYKSLSALESHDPITIAGQPFPVDAAILLSWHHNTSLKRFREMRFLVSSQAKNFDMVIGAQTILKYNLVSRPVFNLSEGIANYSVPDPGVNHLNNDRSTLESRVEDIPRDIEKVKDPRQKKPLQRELEEVKHLLDLKNIEIDLRSKGDMEVKGLKSRMEAIKKDWDSRYPDNTTETVAERFWGPLRKSKSELPSVQNGAKSTKVHTDQSKRSSTSAGGMKPRRH